jgi:flagellar biogenesis protein FliO
MFSALLLIAALVVALSYYVLHLESAQARSGAGVPSMSTVLHLNETVVRMATRSK